MLTKDAGDRDAKTVTECIENVGGTFTGFGGNNTFGTSCRGSQKRSETCTQPTY